MPIILFRLKCVSYVQTPVHYGNTTNVHYTNYYMRLFASLLGWDAYSIFISTYAVWSYMQYSFIWILL